MQEFSLAFSRVSRATIAANPELKNQVDELLGRAYFNIRGTTLNHADPAWVSSLTAACLQLALDNRTQHLSTRDKIQLFENVIRISEEHLREAQRHAAMAANVFYLKETALDAVTVDSRDATYHAVVTTVLGGKSVAHTGRLETVKPGEPIA